MKDLNLSMFGTNANYKESEKLHKLQLNEINKNINSSFNSNILKFGNDNLIFKIEYNGFIEYCIKDVFDIIKDRVKFIKSYNATIIETEKIDIFIKNAINGNLNNCFLCTDKIKIK